jgi:hypothetical protein
LASTSLDLPIPPLLTSFPADCITPRRRCTPCIAPASIHPSTTMAATTGTEGIQLDPKYDDYDFPIVSPVKINGHPGHLTPEQNAAVKQLRESLEKQGYTDRLDSLTLVCIYLILSPRGHLWRPSKADLVISSAFSSGSCAHGSSTSLPLRRCELSPTLALGRPDPYGVKWEE